MCHRYIAFLSVVAAILSGFTSPAPADPLEYDRCSCKLAMKGAESTLKGGVCIRTEASTCLMEWNASSATPPSNGSGLSQRDAGGKAEADFSKLPAGMFQIPRIADSPLPEKPTLLEVAIQNLAFVPPTQYQARGIPESFLLAAGSALARFSRSPMTFIAASLLNRRDEFVNLLSKGGEMKVEQYLVHGNPGCLILEDPTLTPKILIFVKTPFALSERC
jgi:hypothetical protein